MLPASAGQEPEEGLDGGWQEETWGGSRGPHPPSTSSVMPFHPPVPCYPEGRGVLLVPSPPRAGRVDNAADGGPRPATRERCVWVGARLSPATPTSHATGSPQQSRPQRVLSSPLPAVAPAITQTYAVVSARRSVNGVRQEESPGPRSGPGSAPAQARSSQRGPCRSFPQDRRCSRSVPAGCPLQGWPLPPALPASPAQSSTLSATPGEPLSGRPRERGHLLAPPAALCVRLKR